MCPHMDSKLASGNECLFANGALQRRGIVHLNLVCCIDFPACKCGFARAKPAGRCNCFPDWTELLRVTRPPVHAQCSRTLKLPTAKFANEERINR